jgi:uncharacterized protein (DUF433 family)
MDQRKPIDVLLGKGIYSVPDASRLISVPTSRIYRWMSGRTREYRGERTYDQPLWMPELPELEGQLNLSFRDLIELRLVDGFRRRGLSLPYLRKVVAAAQAIVGETHPFTSFSFKTDGRRLYQEVLTRAGEPQLIEVLSGQHAFHSIVSEGLKDIEFEGGAVALWRPSSGREDVVLDPGRSFGQPILGESGVTTAIIRLAASSGRTPAEIGRDFEIGERSVRSALAFEAKLAA